MTFGMVEAPRNDSLVEYARYFGLSKDFTSITPLSRENVPAFEADAAAEDWDFEIGQLGIPPPAIVDERLCMSKIAASYLRSLLSENGEEADADPETQLHAIRDLKVEVPIVSTDTDYEVRHCLEDIRRAAKVPLIADDTFVEAETIIDGLAWIDPDLLQSKDSEASSEKLRLDKTDVEMLKNIFEDIRIQEEEDLVDVRHSAKSLNVDYMTPPLLPISSPFMFGMPASSVGEIELLDSSACNTPRGQRIIDELVLDETLHPLTWNDTDIAQGNFTMKDQGLGAFIPLSSNTATNLYSPLKRERSDDFKVDVPFLSPLCQSSPFKKPRTVSFQADINYHVPAYTWSLPDSDPRETDEAMEEIFGELQDIIEPARGLARNEQLSELDSLVRVEVPIIDQTLPEPPWEVYSSNATGSIAGNQHHGFRLDAERQLLTALKQGLVKGERSWTGGMKVTRWEPFPRSLGRVRSDEAPEDADLKDFLSELGPDDMGDSVFSWKPDGLRALDPQDEDDDEIQPFAYDACHFEDEDRETLHNLIPLHHLKLTKALLLPSSKAARDNLIPVAYTEGDRRSDKAPEYAFDVRLDKDQIRSGDSQAVVNLGCAFSASNSLGRFMQMQNADLLETIDLKHSKEQVQAAPTVKPKPALPNTNTMTGMSSNQVTQHTPHQPAMPALPVAAAPRPFLVPTTTLMRRSLMDNIRQLYPAAIFVERDFENKSNSPIKNRTTRFDEADLLLSASTGIICTTLQQIKQKSLPGQRRLLGIRDRMLRLALRYERLIVLVSEGQPASTGDQAPTRILDQRDCSELLWLTAFAQSLAASTQVMYVPGGEVVLARWVVSSMIRYGSTDPRLVLVQDETYWELFFRDAGFNAFSAQVILRELSTTGAIHGGLDKPESSAQQGLEVFLHMNNAERIRRFERLLEECRVLEQVGKTLDSRWSFASL